MAAIMPSTGRKPEPPEACPNPTEAQRANTARLIQMRRVKAWPALMRFFQSSATAGGPVGRSLNGGRLAPGLLLRRLPVARADGGDLLRQLSGGLDGGFLKRDV